MAVKYVKDFGFDSGFGFSGSSGKTPVRAYMRGGAVKKSNPTKAPSIAPAMVEKRSQGLGGLAPETKKLAAYNKPHMEGKKGAKVPQYAKGGAVKKKMPSFLKAKMMKKADGGEVYTGPPLPFENPPLETDEPGYKGRFDVASSAPFKNPPLETERNAYRPSGPPPPRGMMVNPNYGKPGQDYYISKKTSDDDFFRESLRRDDERIKGDAAEQMRQLAAIRERESIMPVRATTPLPENLDYVGPTPRAMDMIQVDDMIMSREDAERMKRPMPPSLGSIGGTKRDPMVMKPQSYDPGLANLKRQVAADSGMPPSLGSIGGTKRDPMVMKKQDYDPGLANLKRRVAADSGMPPSPLAAAARMAPQDRRAMRADRREMARDIMDRYIAGPRRAMPAPRRAMPVAPRAPMVEPAMIRNPRMPVGGVATFAKGGKVSKGQAKVGKVMGEFKRGELHSGSKQGPLVTNPKQAKAIALSEARKAGAKIPKKAMGGRACG